MKKVRMMAALLIGLMATGWPEHRLVVTATVTQTARAVPEAQLAGEWVGGTDALGDWRFIQARFAKEANGWTGSLDAQSANVMRLPMANVQLNGASLRFELPTPLGRYVVEGQWKESRFTGNVTAQAGAKSKIHLVRVPLADQAEPKINESYAGVYQGAPDQTVLVTPRPFGQLSISIMERIEGTETLRRVAMLIPQADATFFTSGSVNRAPDANELVKFERDGKGAVTGLSWPQKSGDKVSARKTEAMRQEMVQFKNGAVTLNGTLLLPAGKGPHPAMIMVSGAGATTRDSPAAFLRAWQFVNQGMAVLLYDKRGTGHPSGGYWAQATYFDWADDAVAAFRFLQQRADIQPKRIGFQGNSEAGWVIPIAAARVPETAWVIIASGGGITPAESEIHEAEMETRAAKLSAEEISEAVNFTKLKWEFAQTSKHWEAYEAALKKAQLRAWFARLNGPLTQDEAAWQELRRHKDFDPAAHIEKLNVPVLLLFGDPKLDRLCPVTQAIAKWEQAFKRAGKSDYTIQSIVEVGHGLFVREEFGRVALVREPFEAVKTWLATKIK